MSRQSMSSNSDISGLEKLAREQGWVVRRKGHNHFEWTSPYGKIVHTSCTPGDVVAVRKIKHDLSSAGLYLNRDEWRRMLRKRNEIRELSSPDLGYSIATLVEQFDDVTLDDANEAIMGVTLDARRDAIKRAFSTGELVPNPNTPCGKEYVDPISAELHRQRCEICLSPPAAYNVTEDEITEPVSVDLTPDEKTSNMPTNPDKENKVLQPVTGGDAVEPSNVIDIRPEVTSDSLDFRPFIPWTFSDGIFYCLMDSCEFGTDARSSMYTHPEGKHPGYRFSCMQAGPNDYAGPGHVPAVHPSILVARAPVQAEAVAGTDVALNAAPSAVTDDELDALLSMVCGGAIMPTLKNMGLIGRWLEITRELLTVVRGEG